MVGVIFTVHLETKLLLLLLREEELMHGDGCMAIGVHASHLGDEHS